MLLLCVEKFPNPLRCSNFLTSCHCGLYGFNQTWIEGWIYLGFWEALLAVGMVFFDNQLREQIRFLEDRENHSVLVHHSIPSSQGESSRGCNKIESKGTCPFYFTLCCKNKSPFLVFSFLQLSSNRKHI